MMIEVVSNGELPPPHQQPPQHQMILGESSGEDHEVEIKAPKKRAETWVQDETRSLIALRREMDGLFNTSKSNKHLWEQISAKMREKGFDRSPTMCTDKWRNLLKEFKKAKHQDRGSGSAKMSYYKEIEEILRERNKSMQYKSPTPPKVDPYMQFADKGIQCFHLLLFCFALFSAVFKIGKIIVTFTYFEGTFANCVSYEGCTEWCFIFVAKVSLLTSLIQCLQFDALFSTK